MTPRSLLLCLVGSIALHAPIGLALASGERATTTDAATPDVWIGGSGEPVELFDDVATASVGATAPPPDSAPATEAPSQSTAGTATGAERAAPTRPKRTRTKRAPSSSQPATSAAASESRGPSTGDRPGPAGLGDRPEGPARDLLRAFTRAIAPANQADAAWSTLAAGESIEGDVSFELDGDGHVTSSEAAGAPVRVSELLRRTTFLLKGSTFAPRPGEATAGRRRFHVRVKVTDTGAQDVEGGTVELSFDVSAGVGRAWFLRAGGRRVDVEIRPSRA